MKLRNTALINNVTVKTTNKRSGKTDEASNCDWGMELGQGTPPIFTEEGAAEIVAAMLYHKIDVALGKIKVRMGQGRQGEPKPFDSEENADKEFILMSQFDEIFFNGQELADISFFPFLIKNKEGEYTLKFSKSLMYEDKKVNEPCFDAISKIYEGKSWAVLRMEVEKGKRGYRLCLFGINIDTNVFESTGERDKEFVRLWKAQHPGFKLGNRSHDTIREGKIKNYTPSQIIYYGVPGCGKSWQIQSDLEDKGISEGSSQLTRVVFHPDYCNADFVGQIVPVVIPGKGVSYEFKPGPFTQILRSAYEHPEKEYALVVEEINRGNASAIFGDIFQLLDRISGNAQSENIGGNSYGPGWSGYCIANDYINAYLREDKDSDGKTITLPTKILESATINANVGIRLPPNFSIYASMNSSDQNVFTLDNAFQRRWKMKQVPTKVNLQDDAQKKQHNQTIRYKNGKNWNDPPVKWGEFRDAINDKIIKYAKTLTLSSMEDKRLGLWFIVPQKEPGCKDLIITSDNFAEKVLKYLWDDAFKFDRDSIFKNGKNEPFSSLDELIDEFKTRKFDIFVDLDINKSKEQKKTSTEKQSDEI